ncbi:MAG TPA: histidine kinase N-terminal 7TM domain-containing protein [Anaerolineae bacterium]|nr:histidine kinase N-terminal 7TM domain-containing protein [Anaerolineae bacterium]
MFPGYFAPLIIAFIVLVGLSIFAWRRRSVPGALTFAALMFATAWWTFGYIFELASFPLSQKIFWGRWQYPGIVSIPVLWFIFSVQYTQRAHWLTRSLVAGLGVLPAITVLLIWTNNRHGLIWQRVSLSGDLFSGLDVSYGVWFWVHTIFSYILLIFGTLLLLSLLVHRPTPLHRYQIVLTLVAALAPSVGNALYLSRTTPFIPNLDLTPFFFAVTGLALAFNLFRFRLFDLMPLARRIVVDGMSDSVIVLDEQNRLVDMNTAAQNLLGLSPTEALGQSGTLVLSKWPNLIKLYRSVIEGKAEIALRDLQGNQRTFDMRGSAMYDGRQRLAGRVIVLRDITERKEAEMALIRARDQAVQADQLKTELLARVSHELRTPLSAILGYAELLEMGIYGPHTAKQLATLREIIGSSKDLANLVGELLDQAQLDAGRMILESKPVVLAELVRNTQTRMCVLAQNKGLELTTNLASDLPTTVLGDEKRLQQILTNLVGNAIKFTEFGRVIVRLFCPDSNHWAMQVSDTGPGIPAEAQQYIFEPFTQADGSTTRTYGGAGLGLSIVKQLTILMGGKVRLESEPGHGSTFTVVLPHVQEGGQNGLGKETAD